MLILPQGLDRIDLRRPSRWDPCRNHGHGPEANRGGRKRRKVVLGYMKQQIPKRTTDQERSAETKHNPEDSPAHGVRQHEPHDTARSSAKRHTDPDLDRKSVV